MSKLLDPLSEKSFIFEDSNLPEEIVNIILNDYLTTEDKLRLERTSKGGKDIVDRAFKELKYLRTSKTPPFQATLKVIWRCGPHLRRIDIENSRLPSINKHAFKLADRFPLLENLSVYEDNLQFYSDYLDALAEQEGFKGSQLPRGDSSSLNIIRQVTQIRELTVTDISYEQIWVTDS